MREFNFDGLAGPTHHYAGLSTGNLASERHAGIAGNPRAAALQGLAKMRTVAALGVGQAVLPPPPRPDVGGLRRLGFTGTDADVLRRAQGSGQLLRAFSSASAMWAANAATVAPSCDTQDGRVHLVVANLSAMLHRSLEARTTLPLFRAIFSDERYFIVHEPLLGGEYFADEGAANHLRLQTGSGVVHLFGWGRSAGELDPTPRVLPRRQTRQASEAVMRLLFLHEDTALVWQQDADGIDAGAFHTDVLAVGNEDVLLLHEHAFAHHRDLLEQLRRRLGPDLQCWLVHESDLPAAAAVHSYLFNSQLVTVPDGTMAILAPTEARDDEPSRTLLERIVRASDRVRAIHWVDVGASMGNGGGPACLRLRVPLTNEERAAVKARVFLDDALHGALVAFVERHYPDRITEAELASPTLLREMQTALDELTELLRLGSVYDFQKA